MGLDGGSESLTSDSSELRVGARCFTPSTKQRLVSMAFNLPRRAPPLVWKTSHFRNVAVKRISALVSGGGTANHLTGSPVTN